MNSHGVLAFGTQCHYYARSYIGVTNVGRSGLRLSVFEPADLGWGVRRNIMFNRDREASLAASKTGQKGPDCF